MTTTQNTTNQEPTMTITTIASVDQLHEAYEGSWYTISGAGGDPAEWVKGYNDLLTEQEIGTPTAWYQTTGAAVNLYAGHHVTPENMFPLDLTILMFPINGLDARLAMFKIRMADRWFDDVIDNMRRY